jgi:hypothetical protein
LLQLSSQADEQSEGMKLKKQKASMDIENKPCTGNDFDSGKQDRCRHQPGFGNLSMIEQHVNTPQRLRLSSFPSIKGDV